MSRNMSNRYFIPCGRQITAHQITEYENRDIRLSLLHLSLSLSPFMRCVAMEVAVTTRKNKCRREIHPSIHPSVVVEFLSYVFADIIFPGNIASGRLLVAN